MDDKRTAKSVMDSITLWVEDKKQLSPEKWIEAAEILNLLSSYEHDKVVELEQEVNKYLDMLLTSQEKLNVSAAKVKMKADPKYAEFRKQELFVKRIEQAILLAKKHAGLIQWGS